MKTGKVAKTVKAPKLRKGRGAVRQIVLFLAVVVFVGGMALLFKPSEARCDYCTPYICWDSVECDLGCVCLSVGSSAGRCVSIR